MLRDMPHELLTIRPATVDDLDVIVSLTRAKRQQLARWAPVYFNPAPEADELHPAFLDFMIKSADHTTQALVSDGGAVVGFFAEHSLDGESRIWVDDLCVAEEAWWPSAIRAIDDAVASPWVTCVSTQDNSQADALTGCGLSTVSSYWARPTHDIEPTKPTPFDPVRFDASNAAPHTFGGRAFQPDAHGALVVGSDHGYAIGSPAVNPPIYDPGGPTTVIDQLVGPHRMKVLQMAMAAAAERGDAQVVLVCGNEDAELSALVDEAGFGHVVDLMGR